VPIGIYVSLYPTLCLHSDQEIIIELCFLNTTTSLDFGKVLEVCILYDSFLFQCERRDSVFSSDSI
jgi:hypothetical protein